MSVGLIALLDDVAAIAKAAAASLDDVAAQAVKAGAKSAGVVIDDAAVTPRYVLGLSPAREIPIVAKIARARCATSWSCYCPSRWRCPRSRRGGSCRCSCSAARTSATRAPRR